MAHKLFWVALTAVVWILATAFYWVGYTGEDDLFYARYAYLFHRPPMVWWEFRMASILAMRTSILGLGPTEFAAALPSLLASVAIMTSVAWFVGWPRKLTWQSQTAMLLAAVIPIDVGFRSYPSANQISAGFLALGTVCVLKGVRRTQLLGSALLAIGFMAHELSFFYVALFCLTALAFDRKRFWRPVLWCVVLSGGLLAAESLAYGALLGDPLARAKVASGTTTNLELAVDPDTGIQGIRFFAWPMQNLFLSKQFGFNLLLLLVSGAIAWRHLDREQKILFTATWAVFLWLGYGSQVPWAYKPLYRQFHYYNVLSLGVAALMPFTVGHALATRRPLAVGVVSAALLVHVMSLAASGGWGANVDVSRELLRHAQQHPERRFLTDVNTMNHMYVLGGFQLPANVVCLNGEAVDEHLLVNKEPPSTPRHRFPEGPIDGVFVNLEQGEVRGFEREFSDYVRASHGTRTTIAAIRYRLPFKPLVPFLGSRGFMILSAGGELLSITATPQAGVAPPDASSRGNGSAAFRDNAILGAEGKALQSRLERPQSSKPRRKIEV